MKRINKATYIIKRKRPGEYIVFSELGNTYIEKRGKYWKPIGRTYGYHTTLRDAIFAVLN